MAGFAPDMRTTSATHANGLAICSDMGPSTTTNRGNILAKLDRNASQSWAYRDSYRKPLVTADAVFAISELESSLPRGIQPPTSDIVPEQCGELCFGGAPIKGCYLDSPFRGVSSAFD
jgi:hypothetical protein